MVRKILAALVLIGSYSAICFAQKVDSNKIKKENSLYWTRVKPIYEALNKAAGIVVDFKADSIANIRRITIRKQIKHKS